MMGLYKIVSARKQNKTQAMKLKEREELIKKELASPVYDDYTEEEKKEIIKTLNFTAWDISKIVSLFQKEIVKDNFEQVLYLFKIVKVESKYAKKLAWNIICALSERAEQFDFTAAIGMIELLAANEFGNAEVSSTKQQRILELGEELLYSPYFTSPQKNLVFSSLLSSTEEGLHLGSGLINLYKLSKKVAAKQNEESYNSFSRFNSLRVAYEGAFDNNSDVLDALVDCQLSYCHDLAALDRDDIAEKDFEKLFGMFEYLRMVLENQKTTEVDQEERILLEDLPVIKNNA